MKRHMTLGLMGVILGVGSLSMRELHGQCRFLPLEGILPDGNTVSYSTDISENGRFVAGYVAENSLFVTSNIPFRWDTQTHTIEYLYDDSIHFLRGGMISGDGSTIVCNSLLWKGDGIKRYYDTPPAISMQVTAISRDGSLLAGNTRSLETPSMASVWDESQGVQILTPPPAPYENHQVYTLSADSKTFGGACQIRRMGDRPPIMTVAHEEACVWNAEQDIKMLGLLRENHNRSQIISLSSNGRRAAGNSCYYDFNTYFSSDPVEELAFVWDDQFGVRELGLPAGAIASQAVQISENGSVVIGNSYKSQEGYTSLRFADSEAFLWDDQHGIRSLGFLPGDDNSQAKFVSRDGSIVVGISRTRHSETSPVENSGGSVTDPYAEDSLIIAPPMYLRDDAVFVWQEHRGIQSLVSILQSEGIDIRGWSEMDVTGLSADGRTIAGYGTNPAGYAQAWVATIPEPSCVLLLGLGALGIARKRNG